MVYLLLPCNAESEQEVLGPKHSRLYRSRLSSAGSEAPCPHPGLYKRLAGVGGPLDQARLLPLLS